MRRIWTILTVALLLLQTGCDFKDIDHRIFVVAMGIDPGEKPGNFKVSLKLALPQGDITKMDEKMQILTEESYSISEALRRMKSRVEKELDYVHCKSIILGEKLAEQDITHVLDWAVRRRDIQLILNFAIGRPEALKVMHVKPQSEHIPSNSLIMAMSGEGTESPFIVSVYSYQLMTTVYEKGIDPALPIIEAVDSDQFLINKVALLDKKKVRVVLTPNETRLGNLLVRKEIRTNLPAHYNGSMYQYYTESSTVKYKIHTPDNGAPYIQYKIKINGTMEESSSTEMITYPMLKEISKNAGEELAKEVDKLLYKIKATGLDPFGWGLRYFSRHFNNDTEMQEWQAIYPKLKFKTDVKVEIKYSGMIK